MSRRACALIAAVAFVLVAVVTWALAFRTGAGNHADIALLRRAGAYQSSHLLRPAQWLAFTCNTLPYALTAALVVGVALLARGSLTALVVTGLLVIPNGLTQLLKSVTAQDRVHGLWSPLVHVDPASWPSGHSTASLTLAMSVVLIAPATWRPILGALGLVYAAIIGGAVIMLGWHFPSDVVGGFAIGAAGACVAAACLPRGGGPERFVFSRPAATAALPSRSPRAPG